MYYCILFFTAYAAHAYRKFCYIAQQYPRDTQEEQHCFNGVMHQVVPFGADKADYIFTDQATPELGIEYCYVQLRNKDKRKTRKYLDSYEINTTINDALNAPIKKAKERHKRRIGLILNDFNRTDPDMTIGQAQKRLSKHKH
jgi:hypothetical protein